MGRNDRGFDPQDLDNYITGHYGDDQYPEPDDPPIEPDPNWRCVVCKQAWVDAGHGYDTCWQCIRKA